MHKSIVETVCLIVLTLAYSTQALALESYIPKTAVENFIVRELDLSTFRNSLAPRRQPGQRFFKDFKIKASSVEKDKVKFDSDDWYMEIEILRRSDINKDGIEDLEICFTDRAKRGNYDSMSSMLVTKFSRDGRLIALSYEVSGCTGELY